MSMSVLMNERHCTSVRMDAGPGPVKEKYSGGWLKSLLPRSLILFVETLSAVDPEPVSFKHLEIEVSDTTVLQRFT